MQEDGELLAQGLIPLVVMSGHNRRLEKEVLNVLRQPSPALKHAGAKRTREPIIRAQIASPSCVKASRRRKANDQLARQSARRHNLSGLKEFLECGRWS